ncbi:MAG: hypothetical protein ACREBU_23190, partial [Nitrososphaera sp.]
MKSILSFITFGAFGLAWAIAYLMVMPQGSLNPPVQAQFAPEHLPHMTDAEIAAFVAAQEQPVTDDPKTWPQTWKDADQNVKGCSSNGHSKNSGPHGRG